MKKFFGALAVSAVLTGSAYANPFNDVDRDHWAYDAVNKVASSGIMRGYRDGVFKGKETVTRYEMALIISRLIDKLQGGNVSTDVRRTMDRLGEEFMDELDLIGARLTALENAFHEHVTEYNKGGMGGDTNGFKFSGDTRIRWQNRSEDQPTNLAAGVTPAKDDASRYQVRTYVGVEKSVERADLFLELEHFHTFGDRGVGALGTGGAPAAGELDLHQAWADVKISDDLGLKIGRMEIDLGDGSIISSYDYLQAANAFDGWILHGDTDNFDYKLWSLQLDNTAAAAGGNVVAANTELHGLDLDFDDVFEGDLHLFYYHFSGLAMPGAAAPAAGNSLDVYGFDWSRSYDEWDFYVQYATQSGDNGAVAPANIENDGDMWNVRAMYELDEDDTIGIEYTVYSGDDTPTVAGVAGTPATGNSFEGWINVAGDNHSRLGYADVIGMGNVEDITFHWHHDVNERNKFGLAYHMFELENNRGLAVLAGAGLPGWTGVAGPAPVANGNNAAPAAGNTNVYNDDLGDELDLWWNHKLSDDINISLGYAMFSAGDYFTANKLAGAAANYAPDVNYAWISTNIKF